MSDSPDVVIVGGGVAGLGVAWQSAERGASVTVVDDRPGAAASHVAAGLIAPVTEVVYGEEGVLALNVESARQWPTFARRLAEASGMPVPYLSEGTLAVAFDHDDLRVLVELQAFQQELGLDAERLRSRDCRQREPALAPGVRGGLCVPGEGQVENRTVVMALLEACRRAGVAFVPRRVTEVLVDGSRVRGVRVDGGTEIAGGSVVVAAGSWSGRLPGLPGFARPPVRPVKGQILRLRAAGSPRPSALPRTPDEGRLLHHNVRALVEGRSVYLVPRTDGEIVVGGTVEERGFDTTVTVEAVHDLLRDALRVVPGLADLELVEAAAGLRPGTPDNAPVLGPGALEGLTFATGHYRHGFLLLPVTADGIAAAVTGGEMPAALAPFSPGRFTPQEATV